MCSAHLKRSAPIPFEIAPTIHTKRIWKMMFAKSIVRTARIVHTSHAAGDFSFSLITRINGRQDINNRTQTIPEMVALSLVAIVLKRYHISQTELRR